MSLSVLLSGFLDLQAEFDFYSRCYANFPSDTILVWQDYRMQGSPLIWDVARAKDYVKNLTNEVIKTENPFEKFENGDDENEDEEDEPDNVPDNVWCDRTLNIDPELLTVLPPLTDDQLKQLEKNLIKEGWRNNERIIVWNDIIIDGHYRYLICQKHKIPFMVKEMNFASKQDAIVWMIENQLGRCNISDYARGELMLKKQEIQTEVK